MFTLTKGEVQKTIVGEFDDFIGVWDDVFDENYCKDIIKVIDEYSDVPRSCSSNILLEDCERNEHPSRQDFAFYLRYHSQRINYHYLANDLLNNCVLDYMRKYITAGGSGLISTDIKVQKTYPKGGFHNWHHESSTWAAMQRVLVWTVYLNDLPEGEGETEFLNQGRRVSPKRGRVVIWPAGFTHVHRGNPPYTQNKYIMTGWHIQMPEISQDNPQFILPGTVERMSMGGY